MTSLPMQTGCSPEATSAHPLHRDREGRGDEQQQDLDHPDRDRQKAGTQQHEDDHDDQGDADRLTGQRLHHCFERGAGAAPFVSARRRLGWIAPAGAEAAAQHAVGAVEPAAQPDDADVPVMGPAGAVGHRR